MSSIRGFDNLFQDSVNDIALHNYNKGLAHRLRLAEMEAQKKLSFKEPKLLGGVRFSNSILPGSSVEEPATLAVGGGRAYRTFTGDETPAQGGKINRLKKFKKWTGAIGDLVPKSTKKALADRANREIEYGGMVYSNELKKALGSNKKLDGGARKTGRLVKGSPEAKAWAEKMRQAREAKRR